MEAVSRFDPAAVAARVAAFRASSSALRVDVSSIASSTPPDVTPELAASLSSFRIPKVTEDGTCSLPDQLEPLPFDVLDEVVARSAPAPSSSSPSSSSSVRGRELRRLAILRRVCEALQASTGAEWVGIYETVADGRRLAGSAAAATAAGGGAESSSSPSPPSLLKLAYVGSPSRPFFPLTPEFAESSNNSTVAMTGSTVVIHDVRRMPRDTAYYQCDALVKAEVCAPLPRPWAPAATAGGKGGEGRGLPAMGIIDAESWTADSFTPERVDAILDVCAQLAELRLLRGEEE
jgi:L-methionine (R)-S-oxide reductase